MIYLTSKPCLFYYYKYRSDLIAISENVFLFKNKTVKQKSDFTMGMVIMPKYFIEKRQKNCLFKAKVL